MDNLPNILLVAELPYVIGALVWSHAVNLRKSGIPVIRRTHRYLIEVTFWAFVAIWTAGQFWGVFDAYLGIPNMVSWCYWMAALILRWPLNGTQGKVIADEPA